MDPTIRVIAVRASALDARTARELVRRVEDATDGGATCVVIDLASVSFMDSMGLAVLVSLTRRTTVKIVLAGLGGRLAALARLTHLHDVFDVYASAEAARLALAS